MVSSAKSSRSRRSTTKKPRTGASSLWRDTGSETSLPTSSPGFYTKAAAAPAYQWNGLYFGANFGGALNREDVTTAFGVAATDPSGVLGGVQVGYNYQLAPAWLVGIEGELDWTSAQAKNNFFDAAGMTALSVTSDHN
jgi:outer membrane immunogenic protein